MALFSVIIVFRFFGGDIMKKYDSILKRVEAYEKKCEITYAKTNGKLFSYLRVLLTLSVIYMFGVNMLTSISLFAKATAIGEYTVMDKSSLIVMTIIVSASLLLMILTYFKNDWVILVVSLFLLACNIYLIFPLYTISNDGLGFFRLTPVFYWGHLVPFVLILIFTIWMAVIIIRQKYMVNFRYNTIINNLYHAYKNDPSTNFITLSEEEWNEFLENYDPTNMRK